MTILNRIPNRTSYAIALLVISMAALTDCGKDSSLTRKSPGEVVRSFYLAANEGKYSEAEAMLAKEAKEMVNGTLGQMSGGFKSICDKNTKDGNIVGVDIVSEHVRGEGATVVVNMRYKDGTVNSNNETELILRDGKWLVTIGEPHKNVSSSGPEMIEAAKRDIASLMTAIELYALDNNNKYPNALQDLLGGKHRYVKELNKDPWGNDYILKPGNQVTVLSAGPDGKPGTADDVMPRPGQ